MSPQDDKKTELTEWERIQNEIIKFITFFGPPAVIYVVSYYFLQSFWLAVGVTFAVMLGAVLVIHAWYFYRDKKTQAKI